MIGVVVLIMKNKFRKSKSDNNNEYFNTSIFNISNSVC